MAKRKRNHKQRKVVYKAKRYYPIMFCMKEEKPIGLSFMLCRKRVKVDWHHWLDTNSKFLSGYEIDLKNCKKGDIVYCPVCGGKIDFRFWESDTTPDLIEGKQDEKSDKQDIQ